MRLEWEKMWSRVPIRAYAYSRRILRDLVHLVVQKEVSTLTPQMDLSPRTRVYVWGGRWVSNRSGFWPVGSGTVLQIHIKRSLDLSWLMWWISYLGIRYGIMARQPSAWICHLANLWKDSVDPVCTHTSDWHLASPCLLVIIAKISYQI